ncbi:MAG: sigma-70 family RNA polymerase sigma factor [Actinomycetales bacterium]|nr:sigma-70 family RNA polymerase sigma factor [Actinomycetales bacterium]
MRRPDEQVSTPPRPAVDAGTVSAFRSGDVTALAAIYDRYARAVWSVAMNVLGNPALAEDATQETFLRAWRAAGTVDPGRDIGPWLFTIGRRTALDLFRSEYRPTRGSHETEQDGVVVPPGLEQAWEEWQVRQAIAELTDEERAVVRMVHYHRMTHSEIAEVLQVPLGTVKSRSHRAHHRLVRLLGHLADPTGGGGAG